LPLLPDEIDRFARQLVLSEWGAAGQERVRAARLRVVGAGAAAAAAARYLEAAGVGRVERADGGDGATVTIVDGSSVHARSAERVAEGCAIAVEALKAILGLPFRDEVALP
jgi:molybdopterin/thiamine biosynthesis adenylyltransferase